ncbi:condensin-2 complex subunit G2-like isoform X5 [Saccostrea echinata]|nr:condensin-2 complex subunit G2-like isoform X2 [Saccostrea echinata]XP_061177521.1 condensin-2 complex subunit G2-like isoform X3 [Saccostrea echinata]XP_061177522.1 condensin-2 complex subunit G2-like isoform X4 [Saccostrea echinata]XP_061177523.1 condensin-2 complex subunit G2-like isoform X5 [Saccostrea echinata]
MSTACVLHELLLHMPDTADRLKNNTAGLFEEWWRLGLEGRFDLVTNTIIYLLQRSLSTKGNAASVRRVWALHSALEMVDMSNESSSMFFDLLQQVIVNSNYLGTEEGCRFLGFIMTLDVTLTDCLHRCIKNHIPTAPSSWLEKFGEVYFRAWSAESNLTEKLEMDCIQDLMNHAVHAQKSLSPAIRKVLTYIHQQKKKNGVDAMLLNLYEPFLWRSLKVANPEVRGNAAWLLVDAFPLLDPDFNSEEKDILLQKQFDLLLMLLEDPIPAIRSQTVLGVFRIMSLFWELMPSVTIKNIITKVIQDLAFDSTSADVRESVIKGLTNLVDNHLCHLMLKPILPQLQNHIHDTSEKVRVAMVNLMLKVKGVRTIKFWEVVPVEHLLARLEIDSAPVVRRLMTLLFPSFLPLDKSEQEQIPRCVALIQTNPGAARVFYRNAQYFMDVQQTASYMITLCRKILECIREERRRNEAADNSLSDAQNSEEEEDLTVHNTAVMKGLIEVIVILWYNISSRLQESKHKKIEQDLQQKFCLAVPEMLKTFEDPEISLAVILLAGHLPSSSVPLLSRSCLSKLKKMTSDTEEAHYGCLLEAKCKWNKLEDLMELIQEWISSGFRGGKKESSAKKGKDKRKSVTFAEEGNQFGPVLAIRYLSYLITHPICRAAIMTHHTEGLHQVQQLLHQSLDHLQNRIEGQACDRLPEDLLTQYFTMYLRLTLILHDQEGFDDVSILSTVMDWTEAEILPKVNSSETETESRAHRKRSVTSTHAKHTLCTQVVKNLLQVCSNSLLIGIGTADFVLKLSTFCTKCLSADDKFTMLNDVTSCLYHMTEFLLSLEEDQDQNTMVVELLSNTLNLVQTHCIRSTDTGNKLISCVASPVTETINAVYSRSGHQTLQQSLTSSLITTVMDEMTLYSVKELMDSPGESLDTLPPVSSMLTGILNKKPGIFRIFIEDLGYRIRSCPSPSLHCLHGCCHLLTTVAKCKSKPTGLKECLTAIETHVKLLDPPQEDDKRIVQENLTEKLEECRKILG